MIDHRTARGGAAAPRRASTIAEEMGNRSGSDVTRWLVVPLVSLALVLTGCSSDQGNGDGGANAGGDNDASAGRTELKPIIELGVTEWTGSELNVAIAELLIERRLGYPVTAVEVLDIPDMLDDLESGELDAVLEIWPSSLEDPDRAAFDDDRVETLGPLGVVGQIGWYVPRYVIDADPSLATWEGYASAEVAKRFASIETGTRGRFLGTDPAYIQADEEIIEALSLPFDVVYSGSDAATASALEKAYASEEPILLYWWTPTVEVAEFDLVEVALPERDASCEADVAAGKPRSCGYSPDELFKAGAPDLAERAPDLHQFLRLFTIETDDQLAMIQAVEADGQAVETVAEDWVEENRARWEAWFEEG